MQTYNTMDKPEHILLRRRKKPEVDHEDIMSVYNDSRWPVPDDYPQKPHHHHHHDNEDGGGSGECVPVPVNPNSLKIGAGLRVDGNVVSVKIDNRGVPGLSVSDKGLSANALAKKVEWQEKKINEMAEIIVDLKNQINKLKYVVQPINIAKGLAETFDLFVLDNGKLSINIGDGLMMDGSGVISVNAGTGLRFEDIENKLSVNTKPTIIIDENNQFGVNVDNDTVYVNEEGQLSASPESNWEEYKTT